MIKRSEIQNLTSNYNSENLSIGIFGSHSALPIGYSAKRAGFSTILFAKKGREKTYQKYNNQLYDKIVLLEEWKDILSTKNQEMLKKENTIFIPNRSFVVYTGLDQIEEQFKIPLYGSRNLLRAEERNASPPRNQYYLLEQAGVRSPKIFDDPDEIDRLSVVKVQQKDNPLERAYFYPSTPQEYYEKSKKKIENEEISEEGLKKATIEEFIIGPMINSNFHTYTLKNFDNNIELLGFSDREQTNETGYRKLPADLQLELSKKNFERTNEEICHTGKTLRESKIEIMYENAEKLIKTIENKVPPGMIGPIGIQGAIPIDKEKRPEFVVFDLSFRVPGDPAMGPTSPYLRYINMKYSQQDTPMPSNWKIEDPLDLSMLEIKLASQENNLRKIVT